MNIVMIGQKGVPARSGGIERHVELLSTGLAQRGHRVIVFGRSWYVGSAQAPQGITQRLSVGIHTKHLDALTHSFTALLKARRERPDIIHIHGSGIALLTPLARLLYPSARVVFTLHCEDHVLSKWGSFAKFVFRLGERFGCLFAHKTVTVSQVLMASCLRRYGCQAAYIPHPFVLSEANPSAAELASHGLTADQYFLFVGRLIQDKQAHLLIEAYRSAREARPELFAHLPLVLVGGGQSADSYVRWLYRLAASVPGVVMLGERSGRVLDALQAHALAHAFPTSSEGLSIAMLEAGAYAKTLIVSDIPQNREAVGPTAIYARPQDVASFAQGLIQAASLSLEERMRLGVGARAHVASRFDADLRVEEVVSLYQELITRGEMLPHAQSAIANA